MESSLYYPNCQKDNNQFNGSGKGDYGLYI